MHIALLLYGRIGKFKETYENMLHAIGAGHAVDIFCSSDYEPENRIREFKELYKPVKSVHERIINANNLSAYPGRLSDTDNNRLFNLECQMINKMRVCMLLEEHLRECEVTYDLVLCTRIDILYKYPFQFDSIPCIDMTVPPSPSAITHRPFEKDRIYVPIDYDYSEGLNDNMAFGSLDIMKKYCYIYKNVLHLLAEKLSIPHSEKLNLANLRFQNVPIERFFITYSIVR